MTAVNDYLIRVFGWVASLQTLFWSYTCVAVFVILGVRDGGWRCANTHVPLQAAGAQYPAAFPEKLERFTGVKLRIAAS
eukprot:364050-Chlamydomonas_euryale.AAC.24